MKAGKRLTDKVRNAIINSKRWNKHGKKEIVNSILIRSLTRIVESEVKMKIRKLQ